MGISSDDLLKKIDKAPVGILILSGEFEIIFLSDTFRKIAEYYNFKFPTASFNNELFDLEIIREDLSYLSLGYSFEKEVKSITTPGVGRISIIMKGIPFLDGDKFSGGIISVEDIRFSSGQEFVESAFQIQDIIKSSADYLFITDIKGKIRFSSGRKYSSDVIYQNIFDIITESGKREFAESFELAGLKRFTQKIVTTTLLDREEYECRIDPLLNEEGKPNYFLFSFIELGQIVKENQQLKINLKNSEKFRSAADNADEMIYIYDRNLQLHYSNRKAENLPDVAEHFSKKEILNKLYNHPKFGSEFEVEGKIFSAVFTNSGEDLITCFCREVTSEKQELKRIKDSESLLYHLVAGSDQIFLNISPAGNILYSNKFFRENFDPSEGNFLSIIEKNFVKNFTLPLHKTFLEIQLVSHGTLKNYSCSFNPGLSPEGDIQFIGVTGTDISRVIEDRQGLQVYRDIFNNAAEGLALIRNGKLSLVNNNFAKLFGYNKEEDLTGKRINELSSSVDKNRVFNHIREIEISNISSERFEFTGQKMDGSEIHVSASFSPIISGNSVCVIMICRDITEIRRVQGIIRESEEKFRNLTENIDDFLYTYEREGGIQRPVFYTASVEKITGYTQEEFLNDSRLLFKIMHPDDLPAVKKKLKVLLRSRLQTSEELEFRIINRNGNIVWVRNKLNLTRNEQGVIQKIYGLVGDITLRKKAEDELTKSTENLVKLNEAKDKFISIVSHDLRTPFSSILGFTDLLLNDNELTEEEKKQYAQYIQESAKTMLSLVNSLLDLTRLQTGRIRFEPEKFYPASVVDEAIQVLSGSAFQKRIDIINDVSKESLVFADKSLLLQALSNLVSNAIKFTLPGGKIIISASPSDKIRFLQFSVKDNGIGIKKENLENLFKVETKYTSEGTAGEKGSGLGLSLVKEIVEKHGGEIWVESVYGEGSDFKFNIPITPSNILLIDDNSTDRLLYSKILKNFAPDYNIETSANGKEALEKILNSPPALIITDHFMPELNGYEMVLKLKKSRLREIPPVIVLSSELDRNSISAYIDIGVENIFQKPVNLAEFKQTVEKLLRKGYLQK